MSTAGGGRQRPVGEVGRVWSRSPLICSVSTSRYIKGLYCQYRSVSTGHFRSRNSNHYIVLRVSLPRILPHTPDQSQFQSHFRPLLAVPIHSTWYARRGWKFPYLVVGNSLWRNCVAKQFPLLLELFDRWVQYQYNWDATSHSLTTK